MPRPSAAAASLALAFLLAASASGEDPPPATVGEIGAAIEAYERAFAAWVAEISAAPDADRRAELMAARPDKDAVARRLLARVEAGADAEGTVLALSWTYAEAQDQGLRMCALDALRADDAPAGALEGLVPMLERDEHAPARDALEALVAQATTPAARETASVGLASWLLRFAPEEQPRAEALLERVAASTEATPHPEGGTLAETAQARLFELRRLRVGAEAPDIVGIDLRGERLGLRDHRGRVVLLTFWAHWCTGCMVQAATEHALVDAFAGRPFVVIGVNGDMEPPDRILARNAKKGFPWRSFRNDAARGPFGSIARRWNVRTLPTTYLVGHDGMILDKWVGAIATREALLAAVGPAVESAEAAARRAGSSSRPGVDR